MKKGVRRRVVFAVVLILLVSFICAFIFPDFFGNLFGGKITGNVVNDESSENVISIIVDFFKNLFGGSSNIVVQGAGTSATRSMSSTYIPGIPLTVTLTVNFDPADCGGAIVETLPSGWNASSITGLGSAVYNSSIDNKIRWGPIDAPACGGIASTVLTYVATPNSAQTGTKTFAGVLSADGTSYDLGGSTTINQQSDIPTMPTGFSAVAQSATQINIAWIDVSDNEDGFRAYISTNNVTWVLLANLSAGTTHYDSIGLIAGTTYYYRLNAYNAAGASSNVTVSAMTRLQSTSSATRTFNQSSYASGVPLTVTLTVNFDPADCGGAIVETLPSGWNASGITGPGSGVFNAVDNKIRWGPIDAPACGGLSSSVLTYVATPNVSQTGTKTFAGVLSVDGTSYDLGGSMNISGLFNNIPLISIILPYNWQNFTAPANVTINVNAIDSDGTIANVRFYKNDIYAGNDNSTPYTYILDGLTEGIYNLKVIAFDNSSAASIPASVLILVKNYSSPDSDLDGISDLIDECKNTSQNVSVNIYGCPNPISMKFSILPDLNYSNLSAVSGLQIYNSYGNLSYRDLVFLLDNSSLSLAPLNLDDAIDITQNKISLNGTRLPGLNRNATIRLFNIVFSEPKILENGNDCTNCFNISFNSTARIIEFYVTHFTTYEIVEGAAPTTGGSTTGGSSGGGGGSGGGGASSGSLQNNQSNYEPDNGVSQNQSNETGIAGGDIGLGSNDVFNNLGSTIKNNFPIIALVSAIVFIVILIVIVIVYKRKEHNWQKSMRAEIHEGM